MERRTLVAAGVGQDEFDNTYSDAGQYGKVQFWDDRFANDPEPFEWYYPYAYFRETICEYIQKDQSVIVAGCGNSNMLEDMAKDGFEKIIGADLSRVVIEQMKIKCAEYPQIKFFQGTMTDTDLPAGSVDAVIDKALLDSLLCSDTGPVTVSQYVYEVERLLVDTGVFIIISHGTPEDVLPFLEQYDIDEPYYTPWFIDVQAVAKPISYLGEELDFDDPESMYFVYICIKQIELVEKKKEALSGTGKKKKKKKGLGKK